MTPAHREQRFSAALTQKHLVFGPWQLKQCFMFVQPHLRHCAFSFLTYDWPLRVLRTTGRHAMHVLMMTPVGSLNWSAGRNRLQRLHTFRGVMSMSCILADLRHEMM